MGLFKKRISVHDLPIIFSQLLLKTSDFKENKELFTGKLKPNVELAKTEVETILMLWNGLQMVFNSHKELEPFRKEISDATMALICQEKGAEFIEEMVRVGQERADMYRREIDRFSQGLVPLFFGSEGIWFSLPAIEAMSEFADIADRALSGIKVVFR